MPVARISAWIAMACKSPDFWRFLQVSDEAAAADKVRSLCGVASRGEFDRDPEAAQRFHQIIRRPFIEFSNPQ
jgi:hypothetical protein